MNRHGSLNRIYRLIYSRVLNAWVAVSEITKGQGKGGCSRRRLLAALIPMLMTPLAQAAPTGGVVVSGVGHISQSPVTNGAVNTTITQGSALLNLNWSGFNVAPNETVSFNQPSASSVAVNRIYDTNGAQIYGHLNANGQVYLIDPNGILFGRGAQVNVGGLVASTMDFTNQMNGLSFSGNGSKAGIDNQGTLTAAKGGFITLLGHIVSNEGTVSAQLGTVVLAGGNAFTLIFSGNQLVSVVVTQSQMNDLAQNGGILQANGGQVIMTAGAKDALLASAVNNDGIIEAQTIGTQAGHIQLLSGMTAGTTTDTGTLDASAPSGGNGGLIETSGNQVKIGNNANITTAAAHGLQGSWLIDPNDFTIAASGGDITGAALSTALGSNSVTIQTTATTPSCTGATCGTGTAGTGNINVNDTVSWTTSNNLTLNAWNNINFNSAVSVTGSGTLSLLYGQSAANTGNASVYNVNAPVNLASTAHFTTQLGNNGTLVNWAIIDVLGSGPSDTTAGSLQSLAASANLNGHFVLGANIDATVTNTWGTAGCTTATCTGFTPIGALASRFTGAFDGLGHAISNLTINTPVADYVGLFGYTTSTSVIRNVGMSGGAVTGSTYVGSLVGWNGGAISNSYATGTVNGTGGEVGGLVGYNNAGTVSNSYAMGNVTGGTSHDAGGLVGDNAKGGTISNSYATGSVAKGSYTGGLVGFNYGTISNSHATGNVNGGTSYDAGGLVGLSGGTISNSYATGSVSGGNYGGGLVGYSYGSISNSHATGNVIGTTGSAAVGGLVGYNYGTGTISNSYAAGNLSGTGNHIGGLAGSNYGTIGNSYATGSVLGGSSSINVGGLVGVNHGTISNSYATGVVSGGSYVGGLVGYGGGSGKINTSYATGSVNEEGTNGKGFGGLVGYNKGAISNSYATGSVTGGAYSDFVGGLVGYNNAGVTTSDIYATGSVSGTENVGGLMGYNGGTVSNSYATGSVTAAPSSGFMGNGGFIGNNSGSISNSYWDTSTTGQAVGIGYGTTTGATGLTTTQMQVAANFVGFVFTTTPSASGNNWVMVDVNETLNNAGGALGGTFPMLSSEYSTTINNAHQLQLMEMAPTASYTLGQNIDASNTVTATTLKDIWSTTGGFVPIGTFTTNFTGTFDGLGHTISNLTINTPSAYRVGLFGVTSATSMISNVGMVGGSVSGDSAVGGLVGFNFGGTINNSYATGSVIGGTSSFFVGGLVGEGGGTINNSYATGSVTGGSFVGGLVGVADSGTISSSYATGSVTGGTNGSFVGGLVGADNSGTISSSYATGSVTGGTNGYNIGGLVGGNFGITNNSFYNVDAVMINSTHQLTVGGLYNTQYTDWFTHGKVLNITNYSSTLPAGSGGYYNVSSVQGLRDMLGFSESNAALNFRLTTNIDLTGNVGFYVPYFAGKFDGANYTISNLSVSGSNSDIGMFGFLPASTSSVSNLGVVNVSVIGQSGVGGLAGNNSGAISNSYATGTVNGTGGDIGGLVGHNYGTISNSYATGKVTGGTSVGGLVGWNDGGTISNSYATGGVSGSSYVGGLVGENGYGTISNSYATGKVTGGTNSPSVGGLVGYNYGTMIISNSYATGGVSGSSYVGGLVGNNYGKISNVYATGNVSGATAVGGLVGKQHTNLLSNVYAAGIVSGTTDVGGLVGDNVAGTVSNGYWNNTVNSTLAGIGGSGSSQTGATGLSSVQMQAQANFVGFDFTVTPVWGFHAGSNNNDPILCVFGGCSSIVTTVYVDPVTGSSVYGSTPNFTYTLVNASGSLFSLTGASTTGTAMYSASAPTSTSNAGNYTFDYLSGLGLTGSGAANYSLAPWTTPTSWTVTTKPLTVSGLTGTSRTYNGSTVDALTGTPTFTGLVGTQTVALGNEATAGMLASANAGPEGVTAGLTLANGSNGGLASNYSLTQPTLSNVTIAQAPLTVSGLSGTNRTYNGSTVDALSGTPTFTGLVGSESLTFGNEATAGTLTSANAGTEGVTASLTLANGSNGGLAGNYSLTQPTLSNVTIAQAPLTVSGLSGTNRTYNGSTVDALSGTPTFTGLVGSESLTFGNEATAGTLTSANAGTEGVTASLTLANGSNGGLASNYSLTQPTLSNVTIAQAPLTVTANNASKVYGTTASFAGTAFTSGGLQNRETIGSVTETSAGSIPTATVAGGPYPIIASNATGGTFNPANYSISYVNGSLTVTPAALTVLTVNGTTVANKSYDGTNTASLSNGALSGVVGGGVTLNQSGYFNTVNVGSNIPVTATDTLSGSSAGNYSLTEPTGLTANITPALLTVTGVSGTNRSYNGTTVDALSGTPTFKGLVGGESLTFGNEATAGTLTSANAGTEGVTASLTLANGSNGGLAGNYSLTQPTLSNVTIAQAPLTVTADNASKVYGTTATFAGTAFTSGGLQNGETIGSVTETSAGAVATASIAGGPYAIVPSNATGGTFNSANYRISYVNGQLTVNLATPTPTITSQQIIQNDVIAQVDQDLVVITTNPLNNELQLVHDMSGNLLFNVIVDKDFIVPNGDFRFNFGGGNMFTIHSRGIRLPSNILGFNGN